jgi:hypothetical protein
LVQVPSDWSRHNQVPVGDTAVEGTTAHQVPPWRQVFDCGFSPVSVEPGISVNDASAVAALVVEPLSWARAMLGVASCPTDASRNRTSSSAERRRPIAEREPALESRGLDVLMSTVDSLCA